MKRPPAPPPLSRKSSPAYPATSLIRSRKPTYRDVSTVILITKYLVLDPLSSNNLTPSGPETDFPPSKR